LVSGTQRPAFLELHLRLHWRHDLADVLQLAGILGSPRRTLCIRFAEVERPFPVGREDDVAHHLAHVDHDRLLVARLPSIASMNLSVFVRRQVI
jgi:hypothetical protein